jgi:hypothetical protein
VPPQVDVLATQLDSSASDGVTLSPVANFVAPVFMLDDNMSTSYASQAGLFTGEPGGPSLMHLRIIIRR